jgi:hypothetical protein
MHESPAPSEFPQFAPISKSPALAPVRLIELNTIVSLPELLSVTCCCALTVPIACPGNVSEEGEAVNAAAVVDGAAPIETIATAPKIQPRAAHFTKFIAFPFSIETMSQRSADWLCSLQVSEQSFPFKEEKKNSGNDV